MAKNGPDWLDDEDLFEEDEPGAAKDDGGGGPPMLSRGTGRRGSGPSRGDEPAGEGRRGRADNYELVDDDDGGREKKESLAQRLIMKTAKRPGEQEVLKSPLVLSLFGGSLILAVAAGVFWFIIGRDNVTREMQSIDAAINEQRYGQAIVELEDFYSRHPRDSYTEDALLKLAKTRIDKEIVGSSDWPKGLEAMLKYMDTCRDLPKYGEQAPMLAEYAHRISLGALEAASKSKNRDLLAVSEEAEGLLDRFANPDEPPVKEHAAIKAAREKAIADIRKHEATLATYAEMTAALQKKQPIESLMSRRRLLDRYPDLVTDAKLAKLMEDTLEAERLLVVVEKPDLTGIKEDHPQHGPQPLTLARHNRVSADSQSEGRTVFGLAQGCVYGVDTVTGEPIWRRAIGDDTPFFPIEVDTLISGLLVFDSMHQELLLLDRLTGALAWRLPISEPVSGEPLVHGGQIYLPTLGNHLYEIVLQSGEATTRLTFSQPVYSPPILTRDGEHLIVAGNEAVSYTLARQPLSCQRVSFTEQKPGTINVPMLAMGELLLMIENRNLNNAVLRVFDTRNSSDALTEVSSLELPRNVRDRPVLYGKRLFVPAEGEQFNVYTVSDRPEMDPLSTVTNPPGDSSYTGQVHLLVGAEETLWSASDYLRAYQLSENALLEDKSQKAQWLGAAGQPIQNVGQLLYIGQRRLESGALLLKQVDGEKIDSSPWSCLLGCGIGAILPLSGTSVLCMTRSGNAFQVSDSALKNSGFLTREDGFIDLPEGLATSLRMCALPDKRIAVAAGGPNPKVWFVNQAGKVGQDAILDGPPVLDPVPMAGGVLVPLASKLKLLGRSGTVEDFLGTVGQTEESQWSSIVALDENHVLVVDIAGKLSRLQFRTSPAAHLQMVDSIEATQPLDVPPVVSGDSLVFTDASGRLQVHKTANFEQVAATNLDAPAVGQLSVAGDLVLVVTSKGQLHALDLTKGLAIRWSVPLPGDYLVGQPLVENGTIITPTMNGMVLAIDAQTGDVGQPWQLGQSLEHGPLRIGDALVVTTTDGSLYRIEGILAGGQ